jgi:1,2-diacylglycerol 3-alpha-glucosyltransferase
MKLNEVEKLKVLLVSDVYPPYVSGVAYHVQILFKELKNLGVNVKLVTFEYEEYKDPDIISIKTGGDIFYPDLKFGIPSKKKRDQILSFEPDIVHVHTQFILGFWAMNLREKLNVPYIATYHTYFEQQRKALENKPISFWKESERLKKMIDNLLKKYDKNFFEKFDGLISPSELLCEKLKSMGLNNNIECIPCPIKKKPSMKKIEYIDELKLDKNTILFVGRISKEKDVDELILTFKQVQEKISDSKLLIIGDGPFLETSKELVKELGIENKVKFTGRIPREELLDSGIHYSCGLFVTAAKHENNPLSIMEAMFAGLPLIGPKSGGLKELITDNGLLTKPGDTEDMAKKIIKILTNENLRKKFSENSIKNSKKFDSKNLIPKFIDLYQKTI